MRGETGIHGTYDELYTYIHIASEENRDLLEVVHKYHLARKGENQLEDDTTFVELVF